MQHRHQERTVPYPPVVAATSQKTQVETEGRLCLSFLVVPPSFVGGEVEPAFWFFLMFDGAGTNKFLFFTSRLNAQRGVSVLNMVTGPSWYGFGYAPCFSSYDFSFSICVLSSQLLPALFLSPSSSQSVSCQSDGTSVRNAFVNMKFI